MDADLYVPGDGWLHRTDPRVKFLISIVMLALCLVWRNWAFILGILIFIDDYFNCLTVGSVMRPVTDRHQISRPKLAYLIDATAAPVCMIAPISSWAAAVSSTAEDLDTGISGIQLFIRAIPYNF